MHGGKFVTSRTGTEHGINVNIYQNLLVMNIDLLNMSLRTYGMATIVR